MSSCSGIFRLIDIMKEDLTNFAISQNRKAVEDHSAKMEYETFLKYLEHFPGILLSNVFISL